jgi:hypothetical protein
MTPWLWAGLQVREKGKAGGLPRLITNLIAAMEMDLGDAAATIAKTAATLEVTITPIPIPSAAWLLGSGLFGIIAWRRRSTKS